MTRIYHKPARVKELKKAEAHVTEELLNPCRLFILLLISTALVAAISVSVMNNPSDLEYPGSNVDNLSQAYNFDFKTALRTREESLKTYGRAFSWTVERRSALELVEFWDIYDAKWPVIITDVVPKWTAINWTKDFFLEKYGKVRVFFKSIVDGDKLATGHVLSLEEFIPTLQQSDFYTWNYLEDEVFVLKHPELRRYIGHNKYADENFFNYFPIEIKPWDAAFLWGASFSRSVLHMDPYNWTATSAVLSGHKKWKLFMPGQDHLLYIEKNKFCGFPLECLKYNSLVDSFNVDSARYPLFNLARYLQVDVFPGEMLIIPTGWYHQAFNVQETMAISSQIMNRNNYLAVLEEIIKAGNVKRSKLPPHFSTLLPPDQVKLFISLIPKKILKRGKELTDLILKQVQNIDQEDIKQKSEL